MKFNEVQGQSNLRKSWAAIVQAEGSGGENDESSVPDVTSLPVRPANRGQHQVLSRGKLLIMLGHYGWIEPWDEIDHPSCTRHGGRIYLSARDVRAGVSIRVGTEVVFYLYADDDGIGAEDVRPVLADPSLIDSKNAPKKIHCHTDSHHCGASERQQFHNPNALNSQKRTLRRAVRAPPVILIRPQVVQNWMKTEKLDSEQWHGLRSFHSNLPALDVGEKDGVSSETSTSAGDSSDSDTCGQMSLPWCHRKGSSSLSPPPGLENFRKCSQSSTELPPGLGIFKF